MGINYVIVYAFSIDNFRRQPDEVESMMELMLEKIEELLKEESLVTKYGVSLNFSGKLQLLSATEKAMALTAKNSGRMLSACTDEIAHAVQESCKERLNNMKEGCSDGCNEAHGVCSGESSVKDVEKHLYTAGCPGPDIVIRTCGETRLSNFLFWQTTLRLLQNPCPMARILSEAFGLGNFRIPKSTATFGEENKVISSDVVTEYSWGTHTIYVCLPHTLLLHNLS